MQHTKKEDRRNSDSSFEEIDLSVIVGYIGRFFKSIGDNIKYVLRVVSRNAIAFIITFIVGLGLTYALYTVPKPYYTSSMTLVLANIRNEFIEDQLNKLSEMIDDDNFEAVAERLDIPASAAKDIKEMNFYNLDQDRIDEDSVLTGSPFRIELTIYNPLLFDDLETSITTYLENNRYFARQKRIKQRQVENMISKLKGEIASIDSMKTSVSEPRGPVNGFVYGQPIDPTNLYRESITMFKEQVNLESDLEKLANVEIVTGFTPRLKPTGPRFKNYLAVGSLISILIGILVTILLDKRRYRRQSIA